MERIEVHIAQLTSLLFNANRGKQRPRAPKDFLVKWDRDPDKPQSVKEMIAQFKAFSMAHNATIK